jgi:predicted dinucleotide-binding enzyme
MIRGSRHGVIVTLRRAPFGACRFAYRAHMTSTTLEAPLKVAILGTGTIARTLGSQWAARGHTVVVGGRSFDHARSATSAIGGTTAAATMADAATGADAVLLAVPWSGVDDVLAATSAHDGGLTNVTLIDPINPVEHGTGRHLLAQGSVAEYIAARAPGAHVVRAFHTHPADQWHSASPADVLTLAGDHGQALATAQRLVHHVDATPHVLGGLDRARQLEEFAAMIIALAFSGVHPRSAVPGM